jgi:two-component system chemotaxis sensor kinase CheA
MTPLLQQFISEGRDFLQAISQNLMALENEPTDAELMGELFRLVHTLKGNSGLFDFPEMSRVLHAAEDLMVVVRDGDLPYSQHLADRLLDAMDFVSMLMDETELSGGNSAVHAKTSANLADSLRILITPDLATKSPESEGVIASPGALPITSNLPTISFKDIPESLRMAWYERACSGNNLFGVVYHPEPDCFFKGEDPFYQVRQAPHIEWQLTTASAVWPALENLDPYQCALVFTFITASGKLELEEHFRYVPEQIQITELDKHQFVLPSGDENGGPVYEDFIKDALAHLKNENLPGLERATRSMLELSSPGLWFASALRWLLLMVTCEPDNHRPMVAVIESLRTFNAPVLLGPTYSTEITLATKPTSSLPQSAAGAPPVQKPKEPSFIDTVISAQWLVLGMSDADEWLPGRLKAVVSTLSGCYRSLGREDILPSLDTALADALRACSAAPLLHWLANKPPDEAQPSQEAASLANEETVLSPDKTSSLNQGAAEPEQKPNRRSEDATNTSKTLKVDQGKIDRLMNLIGEMVVAKNGLPYLAARAETVFGVRELSREIKNQYAVINRIAEEMQDAIMLVRMLPVSFVFQRFPRLVRDISRKLGKEVHLVLEGEDTEADKNIIEALADPLIHIVRNSLDHGIELPDVRLQAGKSAEGRLTIRASQEGGRVIIDITDDGKGIDPAIIKRKAYEKGLIDEATLERITDQDAVNLVFLAGFSTVEVVSDLSGRGVGMDVVRTAVERVNGTVTLQSKPGEGTRLRMSLPLSMAVTNVMIVESNHQIFGVPMDMVVETVRIRRVDIHTIKNHQTAVLRGRIVPLRGLNDLLATNEAQQTNEADEIATLVIRVKGENIGIVVDEFREVVDIILKPLGGILGGLPGYTGSALLGDGSVLMVLNLMELL